MPQFARPFGAPCLFAPRRSPARPMRRWRARGPPRRVSVRNPPSATRKRPTRSRVKRYVQRLFLAATVIVIAAAPTLSAQNPEPHPADSRLFTQRDAVAAGVATAATLALAAFDRSIAESIADPSGRYQRNTFLGARSKDFNRVNEQTLTLAGLALYGIGRVSRAPTLADISFHAAEAVVVAS